MALNSPALILANSFTKETADEFGAVKGAPCTVGAIDYDADGNTVVELVWTNTAGERRTSSMTVKKGPQGDKGDPADLSNFKEGTNITITDNGDGTYTISATGEVSLDYENLENKPSINGVELVGDKTTEDLGINPKSKMSELEDVALTDLAKGDILVYNKENEKWVNTEAPEIPSKTSDLENDSEFQTKDDLDTATDEINKRIDEVELFKFPNAIIVGNPTINHGQISNFGSNSYLKFPFLVDFKNKPFEIKMEFMTGPSVSSQENIFDSDFGLAFAIRDSKFVIAISSNGTSWNLGEGVGSHTVLPNTAYMVTLAWDTSKYELKFSTDGGETYESDIIKAGTEQPYPKQIFIGVGGAYSTAVNHFTGIVNLNNAYLTVANELVWQGMDAVGIASRLATDLENIDADGINKIREIAKALDGEVKIQNGKLVIEYKDDEGDTATLEAGIDSDYNVHLTARGGSGTIFLDSNNVETRDDLAVKGTLNVDTVSTKDASEITLNDDVKVTGDLTVNGNFSIGDATFKALDFESKGGDFTIIDEDTKEPIHKLSQKQDNLGIVDVEEVYPGEAFKPKQLKVEGEFVAKSSDDTVGKIYKQRDSWLKMTRNGIRMGITSAVKHWEELRRNFIEIGNHKLTIFSTKRLHLESDEHIRMGSHYASNEYEQFNDSRPYSAEVDISGKENRVDISNPYAMFSVDNNGIEIKSTGRDGYSYADMHIGGNIPASTWQSYHSLTPRGIPHDSVALKDVRHKPIHNFAMHTQSGTLLANHYYNRNYDRESGKYYVDWTHDSFVELGSEEAKVMVSKRLNETGYNRTSGDKFGIKCGPHSGVQVYGYLMGGGLDEHCEHGEKPLVVRGGLKIYTHYHTSYMERQDVWEFREDGIYFNGVKKVSV